MSFLIGYGGYFLFPPTVSVVMPVYNREKLVGEAIESILNQSFKDFEFIIVDDGSTDTSGLICEDYSKEDVRFKTFHINNSCVSNTRNYALSIATGEYVAFVDSDDVCEPFMFESLVDAAIRTKSDIVIGAMKFWYQDSCRRNRRPPLLGAVGKEDIFPMIFSFSTWKKTGFNGGYITAKLFRREIVDGLLFDTNRSVCEDEQFLFQTVMKSKSIYLLDSVIYLYRQRRTSVMHGSYFGGNVLRGRLKIAQHYSDEASISIVKLAIYNKVEHILKRWIVSGELSRPDVLLLQTVGKLYYPFVKERVEAQLLPYRVIRQWRWLMMPRWMLHLYIKYKRTKLGGGMASVTKVTNRTLFQ